MDRFSRRRIAVSLILVVVALPLCGCQSLLVTALYLFKGNVRRSRVCRVEG